MLYVQLKVIFPDFILGIIWYHVDGVSHYRHLIPHLVYRHDNPYAIFLQLALYGIHCGHFKLDNGNIRNCSDRQRATVNHHD